MTARNTLFRPKILVPLALIVVLITICMPRVGDFGYSYQKGEKWKYETLVAEFSFPILKTEEQLQMEKERYGKTFVPYFTYSEDTFIKVNNDLQFTIDDNKSLLLRLTSELKPLYQRGILPLEKVTLDEGTVVSSELIYIERQKKAYKYPLAEVYTLSQIQNSVSAIIAEECPGQKIDSLVNRYNLREILRPNLKFDKQTTELVRRENETTISKTSGVFKAGDIIVNAGDIVTADISQILDSYKAEFEASIGYSGLIWLQWLGHFFLATILSLLILLLIWLCRPKILENQNEYLFIMTVFFISCITTFATSKLPSYTTYLVPYPVVALFYLGFLRKRFVLPLYTFSLLPLLIVYPDGVELFIMYICAGLVAIWTFQKFHKGWRQFIVSVCVFAALAFVFITFRLFNGNLASINFMDFLYLGLGSLFVVLVYPLIYLFEVIFNLVSVSRLVDLADTNNKLLLELADKAPGTFQHCLAVMNMVDFAGKNIDADVPLLRAAALYHDIGKTMNPQCFVENQSGDIKYHDSLKPEESASDIIRHVTDGLAIAEKNNIPYVVKEFISTHHGTTAAEYFLNKYLNDGGDPDNEPNFHYPGPKPHSVEHVVLMLCDTLEAASRTLSEYSEESVSKFVDGVIDKKMSQFDRSDISMKELMILRNKLKEYILQVHHGRIAYPKRKKEIINYYKNEDYK